MRKRLNCFYRRVSALSLTVLMFVTNVFLSAPEKASAADDASYDLAELSTFQLGDVLLTDDYFVNASQKETKYPLSFDTDKLLAGFRETAGIDRKGATRYSGWENSLIGGHTHLLPADGDRIF